MIFVLTVFYKTAVIYQHRANQVMVAKTNLRPPHRKLDQAVYLKNPVYHLVGGSPWIRILVHQGLKVQALKKTVMVDTVMGRKVLLLVRNCSSCFSCVLCALFFLRVKNSLVFVATSEPMVIQVSIILSLIS